MATYRTPDVYIEEISVFPPSVAEVETAIPAFIGHTRQAIGNAGLNLSRRPTKIHSYTEYEQYFGTPNDPAIAVAVTTVGGVVTALAVTPPAATYLLAHAVKQYFDNGGGKCYIVAVGGYADAIEEGTATTGLLGGLAAVALEDEPTLLVVPEAIRLNDSGYGNVCTATLLQCFTLKDRFAIFDMREGDLAKDGARLTADRALFGNNHLRYSATYYPWLRTGITHPVNADESNVDVALDGAAAVDLGSLRSTNTIVYNAVKSALRDHTIVMPPSGAVAGVYAATDTARGVWKAPANVSLNNVIEPTVRLDNARQDDLNVDATSGKSINALRSFAGKGTLVWGARTMAGNDNEWRYVNVRRFFNMVEESVKKSTYWAVFEPNDANTWVKVRGMIENYLAQKWREGALAGATPKDAFFVRCALGQTMNAQDILEGRMNVEIGIAVVRPAEFIILKFSHKLQTS